MSDSWTSGNGLHDHRYEDCEEILVVAEPNYKRWECKICGAEHVQYFIESEAARAQRCVETGAGHE